MWNTARLQQHFFVRNFLQGRSHKALIQGPWVYGDWITGLCNNCSLHDPVLLLDPACVIENTEEGNTGRNIYILSNSQVAIKALDSFQKNSTSVWGYHQFWVKLAEHKSIQLVWVPRHMGMDENETAEKLTRPVSSPLVKETEPALGISAKVARGTIRDWMSRKYER